MCLSCCFQSAYLHQKHKITIIFTQSLILFKRRYRACVGLSALPFFFVAAVAVGDGKPYGYRPLFSSVLQTQQRSDCHFAQLGSNDTEISSLGGRQSSCWVWTLSRVLKAFCLLTFMIGTVSVTKSVLAAVSVNSRYVAHRFCLPL